jgi:hypothetical protein
MTVLFDMVTAGNTAETDTRSVGSVTVSVSVFERPNALDAATITLYVAPR